MADKSRRIVPGCRVLVCTLAGNCRDGAHDHDHGAHDHDHGAHDHGAHDHDHGAHDHGAHDHDVQPSWFGSRYTSLPGDNN